ncbi:MAG: YkvA family protein [Romboutsia timonensis]|uniref:YkvA family protein n=1 Tax=Romboutsia timonensis TaxID=1776391 RepID=UPI00399082B7
MKVKATIAGALGYLIVPFDLIPDLLPMGHTDDLGVITAAVAVIEFYVTPETRKKAKAKADELFKKN